MIQMKIPSPENASKRVRTLIVKKHMDFLARAGKDKNVFWVCSYGGAGSGKSKSIAIRLCQLALSEPGLVIAAFRKSGPYVKLSCLVDIKQYLDLWRVPYQENVVQGKIALPNKSRFHFMGMDDPRKLHSFEANIAWLEEATEFTEDDLLTIQTRCRLQQRGKVLNQVYLSWNPRVGFVTKEFVVDKGQYYKEAAVLHSTHRDNPYLDKRNRRVILSNAKKSDLYDRIYNKGEPGVYEGVIYSDKKYRFVPKDLWPEAIRTSTPDRFGIDFGTNDPTVLLGIWYHKNQIYVHQYIYRSGWTIQDTIAEMKRLGISAYSVIYADPSRPDDIMELQRAGFAVDKADNAIEPGIRFCLTQEYVISEESVDLHKEIEMYSWNRNKTAGKNEDRPAPNQMDHAMDTLRYAVFTNHTSLTELASDFMDYYRDDRLPRVYTGEMPSVATDDLGFNRHGGY